MFIYGLKLIRASNGRVKPRVVPCAVCGVQVRTDTSWLRLREPGMAGKEWYCGECKAGSNKTSVY